MTFLIFFENLPTFLSGGLILGFAKFDPELFQTMLANLIKDHQVKIDKPLHNITSEHINNFSATQIILKCIYLFALILCVMDSSSF